MSQRGGSDLKIIKAEGGAGLKSIPPINDLMGILIPSPSVPTSPRSQKHRGKISFLANSLTTSAGGKLVPHLLPKTFAAKRHIHPRPT